MSGILQRPTHVVLSGRLKFNCIQDGPTMIDVATGQSRAVSKGGKWSRPIAPVKPDNPRAVGRGKWDHVKAVGPAVQVELAKGLYY